MNKHRGFFKNNGLSLAALALMGAALLGQFVTGHAVYNDELQSLGAPLISMVEYMTSGHFVSATFENWESEFLQMGMFVLLTVSLRQRGSAESRPFEPPKDGEIIESGKTPWAVKKGGLWLRVYEHSLSLALMALFSVSFLLHLSGSWRHSVIEHKLQGEVPPTILDFFWSAQFWFESFQNWQSEFLAVASLVILSIWLREKDSPQSKPVEAPHEQTGT